MAATRRSHPALTPQRLAELSALAKKVDREEAGELKAAGRAILLRYESIKALIRSLKAARLAKNLSLEWVGESSGIGKANLSRLENHPTPNPTIDTLLRYADSVGVRIDMIISGK